MDIQEFSKVTAEATPLIARLGELTSAEQRRLDVLITASAAIKTGTATLEDVEDVDLAARRKEFGIVTPYRNKRTEEQRMFHKWLTTGMAGEHRSEAIGYGPNIALSGNLASFVPNQFFSKVLRAQAQHSPLFDSENVTYISTDSGGIMSVPWFSDVESVATQIGENVSDATDTGIFQVDGQQLQTWQFSTPRILFSYESSEDIPYFDDLLADILGDRLARGVGAQLINGQSAKTAGIQGLVPSIITLGSTVLAVGSSGNTGGANLPSNSIGTVDIANLFFSLPAPYRASPKFAFICNSSTLYAISSLLDKNGKPILDVQNGRLMLLGKKVLIDENVDSIGLNKYPLIAADLSYWLTRVCPGTWYLKRYTEAPGLVEAGKYAIRLFCREGGCLMYTDNYLKSPAWALQNVSS